MKSSPRYGAGLLCFALLACGGGDDACRSDTINMLGETITIARRYPTTDKPFWSPSEISLTVASDDSDRKRWLAAPTSFTGAIVDAQANAIEWTLLNDSSYVANDGFDGFVVSGFGRRIRAISLENQTGMVATANHDGTNIFVNLDGDYVAGASFRVSIDFQCTARAL